MILLYIIRIIAIHRGSKKGSKFIIENTKN